MKYNKDKITYSQMSESFAILSDWCNNVEEVFISTENKLTASVNLTEMREIDLRRLIELGWKPGRDYEYLYLNV